MPSYAVVWLSFGVQVDSLKKIVSANAEKLLDFIPKFLAT